MEKERKEREKKKKDSSRETQKKSTTKEDEVVKRLKRIKLQIEHELAATVDDDGDALQTSPPVNTPPSEMDSLKLSQQFEELSKKMTENEEQMKEVERQLKRFRNEEAAAADDDDDHQHQQHNQQSQPKPKTDERTDRHQNYDLDGDDDHTGGKSPIFTVLFVKCPLESCFEFALTVDGIKRHLYQEHGIIQRCIASKRCVRQQVSFSSRYLLQKHIREEHQAADGFSCFHCYQCDPKIPFLHYEGLERHFYFNHDEGHFTCARCEGEKGQRRDPSNGCRQYHFSGKYRGDVVKHCNQVHD